LQEHDLRLFVSSDSTTAPTRSRQPFGQHRQGSVQVDHGVDAAAEKKSDVVILKLFRNQFFR